MIQLAAFGLGYLAWSGVHAAHPRRWPGLALNRTRRGAAWLRGAGALLTATALMLCMRAYGIERGIFVGFAVLTLSGMTMVFFAGIRPGAQKSALMASCLLVGAGLVGTALTGAS
ncbi:DUF3325 family protein [uncultured Algimonas sp.]|uniref:DUF3325 family protein n=1 Tax=uncultured Algimonas sp. TaxID=1547920 RepID=UPI002604497C|nr:DUF3325 family protein [uncultured Algimonas sp.]